MSVATRPLYIVFGGGARNFEGGRIQGLGQHIVHRALLGAREFDLVSGHMSFGFQPGGALYSWGPIMPEVQHGAFWDSEASMMDTPRKGASGEYKGQLQIDDIQIYQQMSVAAEDMGFDTAAHVLCLRIDACIVESAESKVKLLLESGARFLPGFPTHYAYRGNDGTYPDNSACCIGVLAHLGLISDADLPWSMQDLLVKWRPQSHKVPMHVKGSTFLWAGLLSMVLNDSFAHTVCYEAGESVIKEGQYNDALFSIQDGVCSVSHEWRQQCTLVPGSLFAELSFLTEGEVRTASSVKAVTAVTLHKVSKAELLAVAKRGPWAAASIKWLLHSLKVQVEVWLSNPATRELVSRKYEEAVALVSKL